MDITNKIYNKNNILDEFENKYLIDLSLKSTIELLFYLRGELNGRIGNVEMIKEMEDSRNLLCEDALKYLNGELPSFHKYICDIVDILIDYADRTYETIVDGYCMTVPQVSCILDLNDNYISRNLIDYFDRFTIYAPARHIIKKRYININNDFINKKVFIKEDSFRNFLTNHLKLSTYRVQIDFKLIDIKYSDLLKKFKKDKTIRSAVKRAVEIIEDEIIEEIDSPNDIKKINRMDLPVIELEDKMIDDIMSGAIKLRSVKTIKNEAQIKLRDDLEHEKGAYKFKSINDTQIYRILDESTTCIRFVMKDLIKYNKQKGDTEEKIIVKYSVNINNVVQILHAEKENNMYSMLYSVYLKLTENISEATEEEKNKFICNLIFNRVMEKGFKIRNKKGTKEA